MFLSSCCSQGQASGHAQSLHHNFCLLAYNLQAVNKIDPTVMIVHIEISTGTRVSGLSKLITLPFGGNPAGKKHREDKSIVGCNDAVNGEEATQKKLMIITK